MCQHIFGYLLGGEISCAPKPPSHDGQTNYVSATHVLKIDAVAVSKDGENVALEELNAFMILNLWE